MDLVALPVWTDARVVVWSRWLLDSYRHWTGRELIERLGTPELESRALFESPVVVVSHGTEADPILNYGNQAALALWELSWEQLSSTPSRLTAEPVNRPERERMLEAAKTHGYFDKYRGIRITSAGRRFLVEQAVIWTVLNVEGTPVGQAASFSHWRWLQEVEKDS